MDSSKLFCVLSWVVIWCLINVNADNPCAARQVNTKSVICVCNVTYCDTVTRVLPNGDSYVTYTSSESGMRFNKTIRTLVTLDSGTETSEEYLTLDPETKYQTIEGFGGAVTDSAAINWKNLLEPLQKLLIDSYFSDKGLQYNTIRVPIGGTDFSTRPYAYNDLPEEDARLTNFSLSIEDYKYKIPMIKAGMSASSAAIHLVASTWSPPPWMKTNNWYSGRSSLKPEYYQTYANYHLKFLEKYKAEGIPIWAITTTNEPTNGLIGLCAGINCVGWSAKNMGHWIQYYLGPTIRNSEYKNVKILAGDDQRLTIPYWMNYMVIDHPEVLNYIDGIAVHYYTDFMAPAALLTQLSKFYPDKFIISTEGCAGSGWFTREHVVLGSWRRARAYILDIIADLNYNVVGWIDWNMCLNAKGGPTWANNYVDSPIIVFPEKGEFIKQPMFYAMGHFSKFIPRGSKRIKVTGGSCWRDSISKVAFITPKNTVVAVLYNNGGNKTVKIKLGDKLAEVDMVPSSIATIELPYKEVKEK